MNIVLVEPFFTGSHAQWAKGYQAASQHNVQILSLKGQHWKWRMHGGAITLAQMLRQFQHKIDLLLVSDMLDLTTFLSLTRKRTAAIPVALYMHENQLTYPWSPSDKDVQLKRNNHYSFINYTSALAADKVFFNSAYHKNSFLQALPNLLQQFPDYQNKTSIAQITQKSSVLHLGLNLTRFDKYKVVNENKSKPLLIWNHRWEYDKNPTAFFSQLFQLADNGYAFELAVLGEQFAQVPPIFVEAKKRLAAYIVQWGYANSFEEYAQWLWRADILPVTSNQDFFGGSVVEAMYCNTYPILPKRLAYPEHIPQSYWRYHYYNTPKQFNKLLNYSLKKNNDISKVPVQNYVCQYDWLNMALQYDNVFAQMTKLKTGLNI